MLYFGEWERRKFAGVDWEEEQEKEQEKEQEEEQEKEKGKQKEQEKEEEKEKPNACSPVTSQIANVLMVNSKSIRNKLNQHLKLTELIDRISWEENSKMANLVSQIPW